MRSTAFIVKTYASVVATCLMFISCPSLALSVLAYDWAIVPISGAKQVLDIEIVNDRITIIFSEQQPVDTYKGDLWVATPTLPPGTYTLTARSTSGVVASGMPLTLNVVATPSSLPVFSLFHPPTNTFFATASQSDQTALLAQGWQMADGGFTVWPASGPSPLLAKPVCRFFIPAKATHFYSASATDCALLKTTPGFVDEGIAFRALLPLRGSCGLGTKPVYRMFDSVRANHRYVVGGDTAYAMVTAYLDQNFNGLPHIPSTWVNEGIAFCSPIQ